MENQFSTKAVANLSRHGMRNFLAIATLFWHVAERVGEDLTEARVKIRVMEERRLEEYESRGIDTEDNYIDCIGRLLAVSKLFGVNVDDLLVRYAKRSHNFATPLHRKADESLALSFFTVPTGE